MATSNMKSWQRTSHPLTLALAALLAASDSIATATDRALGPEAAPASGCMTCSDAHEPMPVLSEGARDSPSPPPPPPPPPAPPRVPGESTDPAMVVLSPPPTVPGMPGGGAGVWTERASVRSSPGMGEPRPALPWLAMLTSSALLHTPPPEELPSTPRPTSSAVK